jgi:hypothetical protein
MQQLSAVLSLPALSLQATHRLCSNSARISSRPASVAWVSLPNCQRSVGFSVVPFANWLPSEMRRFRTSCVCPYLLQTRSREFALRQQVPMLCDAENGRRVNSPIP